MLLLGLLLLLAAAALTVVALFLTEAVGLEMGGVDVEPVVVFLAGAVAMLLVALGLMLLRGGTRRGLKNRRERKRLTQLSEKLDRVESERRGEDDSSAS